jgi:hypothetical protein
LKGKKSVKIIVIRKYSGEKNIEQAFSEVIMRALQKEMKSAV